MTMNDDAASEPAMPLFLSNDAEQARQNRSSRIRNGGLLVLAGAVVVAAVVTLGYSVARRSTVPTSSADVAEQQPDSDRAVPPPEAAVDAQAPPPADSEAPAGQSAATAEPVGAEPAATAAVDPQVEAKDKAASDALFMQFQAWAERQNSKPDLRQDRGQAGQAQDAPAQSAVSSQSAESTRDVPPRMEPAAAPPVRAAQKHRSGRELRTARAEEESARRAKERAARAYWTPAEEPRAPDPPLQSTDTPWLLRLFGAHN